MSAEYALRAVLNDTPGIVSESAGTEAKIQEIHPVVRARLGFHGLDPTPHRQRRVTREILESVDTVIAMGLDHQEFLEREFGVQVPLFLEFAAGRAEPILDLHEKLPDYLSRPEESRRYVEHVIDTIVGQMPALKARLTSRGQVDN